MISNKMINIIYLFILVKNTNFYKRKKKDYGNTISEKMKSESMQSIIFYTLFFF